MTGNENTAGAAFECCPPFDPQPWQEKFFDWKEKRFVSGKVCTMFYMPLNFGKVISRLYERIKAAGAESGEWLCLSDHTSKWNMDIYLAVDKEIPGAENITLSGRFFSKVYEGPFKDTKKWCDDFEATLRGQGLTLKKQYMWYTVCPKCAKKYGKNYVVIIGQVE